MIARLFSMGLCGLEAFTVEVEADLAKGVPCFDIVGLPGTAVKESRERVRSALKKLRLCLSNRPYYHEPGASRQEKGRAPL